jgi:hypothetical protein
MNEGKYRILWWESIVYPFVGKAGLGQLGITTRLESWLLALYDIWLFVRKLIIGGNRAPIKIQKAILFIVL